jgi:hypothetical protein
MENSQNQEDDFVPQIPTESSSLGTNSGMGDQLPPEKKRGYFPLIAGVVVVFLLLFVAYFFFIQKGDRVLVGGDVMNSSDPSLIDGKYKLDFFLKKIIPESSAQQINPFAEIDIYGDLPTIWENKVMYLEEDGRLAMFNISQNTTEYVDLGNRDLMGPSYHNPQYSLPRINDYFPSGESLYILYGRPCNEYLAKCDSDLLMYNFSTKEVTVLASNLAARDILGFNQSEGIAFLRWSDGDAGCIFSTVFKFNLKTKAVESQNFGSCEGDTNQAEDRAAYQAFISSISDISFLSEFLYISSGRIVAPSEESRELGDTSFKYIGY